MYGFDRLLLKDIERMRWDLFNRTSRMRFEFMDGLNFSDCFRTSHCRSDENCSLDFTPSIGQPESKVKAKRGSPSPSPQWRLFQMIIVEQQFNWMITSQSLTTILTQQSPPSPFLCSSSDECICGWDEIQLNHNDKGCQVWCYWPSSLLPQSNVMYHITEFHLSSSFDAPPYIPPPISSVYNPLYFTIPMKNIEMTSQADDSCLQRYLTFQRGYFRFEVDIQKLT